MSSSERLSRLDQMLPSVLDLQELLGDDPHITAFGDAESDGQFIRNNSTVDFHSRPFGMRRVSFASQDSGAPKGDITMLLFEFVDQVDAQRYWADNPLKTVYRDSSVNLDYRTESERSQISTAWTFAAPSPPSIDLIQGACLASTGDPRARMCNGIYIWLTSCSLVVDIGVGFNSRSGVSLESQEVVRLTKAVVESIANKKQGCGGASATTSESK